MRKCRIGNWCSRSLRENEKKRIKKGRCIDYTNQAHIQNFVHNDNAYKEPYAPCINPFGGLKCVNLYLIRSKSLYGYMVKIVCDTERGRGERGKDSNQRMYMFKLMCIMYIHTYIHTYVRARATNLP